MPGIKPSAFIAAVVVGDEFAASIGRGIDDFYMRIGDCETACVMHNAGDRSVIDLRVKS